MSTCTIPLGAQEDPLRKIIGSGWPETLTRPLPEGEENIRGVLVNQGGLPTQVTTRGRGVLLFRNVIVDNYNIPCCFTGGDYQQT